MATTAKKFVKVTGLSQVFAESTGTGNWHGYNISQIKSGVTAADNNSVLFIEDTEWGKWIWAQGRMYSGNDMNDFNITINGDTYVGVTSSRDAAGNYTANIWHQGASIQTGTTTASAGTAGSNFTFTAVTDVESDGVGHATKQIKTEFTIPVAGVTGDTKVKVGKSGTQYYITHATGASGTYVQGKSTNDSHEVVITTPSLTFDTTGHLTSTGSTSYKITAADLGVDGVLHFLGVTTTEITDGSTTNPIVIGGETVTAQKGDIVLYGSKEFVWSGSSWEELGDESKYLLGATGDGTWISATVNNSVVNVSHTGPGTAVAGITGKFINSITYDSKGHIVAVGSTGISTSTIGVTGPTTAGTARIKMTGEDSGYVNVVGASGIEVKVTTAGTNAGTIQISQTDKITPEAVTGSTYRIAYAVVGGATSILVGKDTTYTIGSTAVNGTSGAEIKTTFTPSTGTATTLTTPIISPDDSIVIGATQGKVVVNYTGVATAEDWGFIPES